MLSRWARNPCMLAPLVLSLAYLGPSAVMPRVWLNLRSVQVTDAATASDAWVEADRAIHMDFNGRYQVTFRDAATHEPVCTPPVSPIIPYGGGKDGKVYRPLSWWIGGKDEARECEDEGLRDGRFYAVTCQDVVTIWGGSIARRCVRSNDFTLGVSK